MPPHAHGGGDEPEEVIVVRTDGPPFVDVRAKQGKGFEADFDRVQKFLGPGKISLVEFTRDVEAINKVYEPTAHRSFVYLRYGSGIMLAAFSAFIVMGIIGGTAEIRGVVVPIITATFLVGVACFWYSKWIEQPGIKAGAAITKKLIDEELNPRYEDSAHRLKWVIRVNVQKRTTLHMNKAFVERPILSLYALRSHNDAGVLCDWTLPDAYLHGLLFEHTARKKHATTPEAEDDGWAW